MLKIALTGGIACGKSLAGEMLRKAGVPVCETDAIGHAVLEDDAGVRQALEREFGGGVLGANGRIDRAALGRMVFTDARKRERLNALTHPAILTRTAAWVQAQARTQPCVVVIIPLLYEIGAEQEWDRVICVAAPEADQLRRLEERGLSRDEARARIAAQMSQAAKMERADFVIYNSGSVELLEEQVNQVMRKLRGA